MRPRIDEFDFGRGIGTVAKLVFQALDVNTVAGTVGQPARHEKARKAAVRLREYQVRIALRRREKPLMAGDAIGTVGRARRTSGIGTPIRASLFFRHAHADQAAAL